jgi:hypothetical protein
LGVAQVENEVTMQTIQYTTIDKSQWPAGPWQDEPDKIQWMDEATRLPCLIVRGPSGALCGYVGVAEGHRYFGASHEEVPVEVHGGLTFSGVCQPPCICHLPGEVEADHVHWLGFDCAHSRDVSPGFMHVLGHVRDLMLCPWTASGYAEYRDVQYVKAEVAKLAAQLAAA